MSKFISYHYEEHLITRQNKAEAAFLADFEEKSPSLAEAMVIVNPYFINPLCALVLFKTEKKSIPTLTIHGKRNSREDIVKVFKEDTSHVIPVIGLYEGIDTKITISLSTGEQQIFNIQAHELPDGVSRCRSVMTSIDYFGTDFMFLTSAGKERTAAYDYMGDLRWLLTIPTMFDLKRLQNGNVLTGSYRYSHMPYHCTGLVEMNLLGKIYKEYRMPGDYHHDHFELENGNIMALTQEFSETSTTVEDMIALLDKETGEVLRTWDYKDFLPTDAAGSGSQSTHDWFHNNALWVDEKNNTITISGRHQDAIVNFNYDDSTINWIIGDPDTWPEDMKKYFFTPVGDNFEWQYEQHACVMCPNGDIMAFDNGRYRSKRKENYILNKDNFSRGVRYNIDTEKMEIKQVWQFGKEFGQSFFSPYISNVEFYAEGHYLIHSGGIGSIGGNASDNFAAFFTPEQLATSEYDMCSKTFEQKDGVVMYYLEVDGNFYRAERLPAYHEKENASFEKGKILGELGITPTFSTIPDVEETLEMVPAEYALSIVEEEDKLVLTGSFKRGLLVMYTLEGKENNGYYINTAAVDWLAMCSAAFLEKDVDITKFSISKRNLSGKYDIKLIIDNKKYQTGVSIFC